MTECIICLKDVPIINWHHTIPRSRGGENSLQIPLCPTCHDTLHAAALNTISCMRKGKRPKIFWSADDAARADKWLEILVGAIALPIAPGYTRKHLLRIEIDTQTFEEFKLFQMQKGLSQEKTLLHLVKTGISSTTREKDWFLY